MAEKFGKSNDHDDDSVKETVRCCVCLELYEDPRVLPCLHTFCLKCLTKMVGQKVVKCPVCRREHEVSPRGVSGFLSNSRAKSDVELVRFRGSTSRSCGMCEDISVIVSFCNECQVPLCALCHSAHKRMMVFRGHAVVAPKKAVFKAKRTGYPCPVHTEELLKVYCEKCGVVVCRDCILYSHREHTVLPAEQAASRVRQHMLTLEGQVQQKLEQFEGYAEEVERAQEHFVTYPDTLKEEIVAAFDGLSNELEKRKQVLLNKVDSQYDAFTKQAGGEKDWIGMTICRLQTSKRFVAHVKQSSDDLEQVVLGTQAVSHMKKMVVSSWKPEEIFQRGPLLFSLSLSSSGVRDQFDSRRVDPRNVQSEKPRDVGIYINHPQYIQSIGNIFHVSKVTVTLSPPATSGYYNPLVRVFSQFTVPSAPPTSCFCTISVRYLGGVESHMVLKNATMTTSVTTKTEGGCVSVPSSIEGSFAQGHFVLEFSFQTGEKYTITAMVSIAGKVCGMAMIEREVLVGGSWILRRK